MRKLASWTILFLGLTFGFVNVGFAQTGDQNNFTKEEIEEIRRIHEELKDVLNFDETNDPLLLEVFEARKNGDDVRAVESLRKSAEKGNNISQFILGTIYMRGDEAAKIPQNDDEAKKWLTLSCKGGSTTACWTLERKFNQ